MKSIKRARFAAPGAIAALLVALATMVSAVADTLPGGSSIEVSITSPANGAIVPQGPVTVSGSASVGQGVPVANTVLVYVLDLSGSTQTIVPGTLCGAQNFDPPANSILDCEIAAAKALNNAAIGLGTVFEIAAVGFGGLSFPNGQIQSAFILDLSPATLVQHLIPPNGLGTGTNRALDEALFRVSDGGQIQLFSPANVGSSTNYWAAVQRAVEVANESTATNKVVVFLSDGLSTAGGPAGQPVSAVLGSASGITFHTFAIGADAACTTTQATKGTLQEIADATGGTCTELSNPQDAIDVLPQVIGSSLTGVSVSVDGGGFSPAATTPGVPLTGPASANWQFTTSALTPGDHQLCAKASGTDGGGAGSVSECITVHVNAAPVVTATGGSGVEGSPIAISANITDDGSPSISWSYVAGIGVDSGTTCGFGPAAAATTFQCNDDGTFTVTATVNDGINPPVAASATVTVTNANPTVHITSPAAGATFAVGAPVALTTTTSDPGSNDAVTCSINWGDGVTTPGCGTTHTYAAGTFTIVVTASDGDGGTATDSVTIRVNHAPSCSSVAASPSALWPPNNKFVRVALSGGSDPDGDAISISVTGVSQDEPASVGGDASLAGANAVNLRASRLGSGDGRVYEVRFTITDAHGATCSSSTIVGVPHDQSGPAAVDSGIRYPSLP